MNTFSIDETLEEGEIEEDIYEEKQVSIVPKSSLESDDRTLSLQQKSLSDKDYRTWPLTYLYVKDEVGGAHQPVSSLRVRATRIHPPKLPVGRERLKPRFVRQFRGSRQRPRHVMERNKNPHDLLSYEDLLSQYKEIQSQLEELKQEEVSTHENKLGKENVKSSPSHRSAVSSRHNLSRSRSSRRIRSRSRSSAKDSSRSKSPQVKSNDEEEDEDEQELRRIALASARDRKTTQKDSPERIMMSQEEPQITQNMEQLPPHLYDNYDQVAMDLDSNSSIGEEDEEFLRSTVLKSMTQKSKNHKAPVNNTKTPIIQGKQETQVAIIKNIATPLHKPVVINLAEDSTDSEDDEPKLEKISTVNANNVKPTNCGSNTLQVLSRNNAKTIAQIEKNREIKSLRLALKSDEQQLLTLKTSLTKKRALCVATEQKIKQLNEQLVASERLLIANRAEVVKVSNQIKVVQSRSIERRAQLHACLRVKSASHQQFAVLKSEKLHQNVPVRKQSQVNSNVSQMTPQQKAEEKARLERLEQQVAAQLKYLRKKNGITTSNAMVNSIKETAKTKVSNDNQNQRQLNNGINVKINTKNAAVQKDKINHNNNSNNTQEQQLKVVSLGNAQSSINNTFQSTLAGPHNLDLFVMNWPTQFDIELIPSKCENVPSVVNPLSYFKACRLRSSFDGRYSSSTYAHKIKNDWVLCSFDLMGTCNDDQCPWQHARDYLMNNEEILIDIASYHPATCGINPQANSEEKQTKFREYAVKSLKDPSKFEEICRELATKINRTIGERIPLEPRKWKLDRSLREKNKRVKEANAAKIVNNSPITDTESTETEMEDDEILQRYFMDPIQEIDKLEMLVKADPKNSDAWLQLADLHYKRHRSQSPKTALDRSLHILSRALEFNRHNSQLWHRYLTMYERHSDNPHMSKLCEQAFNFAPSYQLGYLYLKHAVDINTKLNVCGRLWLLLVEISNDPKMTPELRSLRALEILLRQTELHIQKNQRTEDGIKFLEVGLVTIKRGLMTSRHSYLAWMVLLHLQVWSTFPPILFNGCCVTSEEPLLIFWSQVSSPNSHIPTLELALKSSHDWHCNEVFFVYWNLVELHLACKQWDKAIEVCRKVIDLYPTLQDAWILLMKVYEKFDCEKLLEVTSQVVITFSGSPRIHFVASLVSMKYDSLESARNILHRLTTNICGETLVEPNTCFRQMLNLSRSVCKGSVCLPPADESDRAYLWLAYSLLLSFDNQDVSSTMDMALARVTSKRLSQLMWSFYLRVTAQSVDYNKKSWLSLLCRCLLANSSEFQTDTMNMMCQSLVEEQCVPLLETIHKCVPSNANVLLRLLSILYRQGKHVDVVSRLRDAHPMSINVIAAGLAIASAVHVLPSQQVSSFCVQLTSLFPSEFFLWDHAAKTLDSIGQSEAALSLRERSPGVCFNLSDTS